MERFWRHCGRNSPQHKANERCSPERTLCGIQIGRNWLEYVCAFFYNLEMSADHLISGDTETKKYTCAVNGVWEMRGAFEGLSASVSASQNQLWGVQYDEALYLRLKKAKVFTNKYFGI
jgi:hypothetical protein